MKSANGSRLHTPRGNAGSSSGGVADLDDDIDVGALQDEPAAAQTSVPLPLRSYRLRQPPPAKWDSNDQGSTDTIGRPNRMRIAAFATVGLIVCLSLLPGAFEIRTGLPGSLEHYVAYLGTGAVLAALMPDRSGVILFGLVAAAALLEGLQGLVPDRSPTVVDAFIGGLGAASGVGAARFYGSRRGKETAPGPGRGRLP